MIEATVPIAFPAQWNLWRRDDFQQRLAYFNQRRLRPATVDANWQDQMIRDLECQILEGSFVEDLRRPFVSVAAKAPRDAEGFVEWFGSLKEWGPGQNDPLFAWLAKEADLEEMRWFMAQEVAGEAGFDDLVALTQVKFPATAKLELARNYWDEMGRGHAAGMHGPMLARTAEFFELESEIEATVWESLALANLMTALATNRRYAYHSIGALGAIEMTAPGRVSKVNEGLLRLGAPGPARQYHELHAQLDIRHSEAWNREVIHSLVKDDPTMAQAIAEGALMRLSAGQRCFERYRREFGLR